MKPSINPDYMDHALQAAVRAFRAGEAPFGACLVKDGELIACAENHVRSRMDVTAHAEMNVLREAFRRLNTTNLSGCVLYSTCEPCPMCFSACHDARISTIVYGADLADAEKAGYPGFAIPTELLQRSALLPISIHGSVRHADCLRVLNSAAPSLHSPLPLCFLEQARQRPDAVAVSYRDERLTYGEVADRAWRLAKTLEGLAVARGEVVAICMPRSCEAIIVTLAVLLAGAAYLHISPEYPKQRRRFLLEDSEAAWLITVQGIDLSPLPEKTRLLDLEALDRAMESNGSNQFSWSETEIMGKIDSNDLAYLMYTSGTTGEPTGVMVSHGNIARLFPALGDMFRPNPTDRWTCCHPPSFGFSVWEIWGALAHGGELVIVPQSIAQQADDLLDLVRQRQITVLSLTPTAFRMFDWAEESSRNPDPLRLRCITFSGEPLPLDVVRPWIQRHGDQHPLLVNTYALTETSGQVTLQPITSRDLRAGEKNLIGYPLSDITIRLLDDAGVDVSEGECGELYVGGPGVAQGYWRRPTLNKARYLDLDASPTVAASARMRFFRTGDLAKIRPDGRLEYMGRRDRQIKRNGFRIEPAEIEAALRSHPDVRDALVVAKMFPGQNDPRLDAYVVSARGEHPAPLPAGACEIWPSLGEYQIYDAWLYSVMGLELERHDRFRSLIQESVHDQVVVDLGTGNDAVLARLCVEAGARKVYAIEVLEEQAAAASTLVGKLGLSDRIEVLCGDAATMALPEPADLVISRLMGNIGSSDGMIPLYRAARRWLTPAGRFLPERFVTRLAAIALPDVLRQHPVFATESIPYVERIFAQVGERFDLRLCLRQLPSDSLLTTIGVFEDLDFKTDLDDEAATTVHLSVLKSGRLDGLLLWLEVWDGGEQIADYLREQTGWLPVFLPLFDRGLEVSQGDELAIRCCRTSSAIPPFPDYLVEGDVLRHGSPITHFSHRSGHGSPPAASNPFHAKLLAGLPAASFQTRMPQNDLRSYLTDLLPSYMMPSSITMIDELPTTANGKVDLASLPQAMPNRPDLPEDFVAASTATEAELCRIWKELLELNAVGIHDNFFELGGNSLLAVQVIHAISLHFGCELRLREMFDRPTIAGLSQLLDATRTTKSEMVTADLMDRLRGMSEEEVEHLLDSSSPAPDIS